MPDAQYSFGFFSELALIIVMLIALVPFLLSAWLTFSKTAQKQLTRRKAEVALYSRTLSKRKKAS